MSALLAASLGLGYQPRCYEMASCRNASLHTQGSITSVRPSICPRRSTDPARHHVRPPRRDDQLSSPLPNWHLPAVDPLPPRRASWIRAGWRLHYNVARSVKLSCAIQDLQTHRDPRRDGCRKTTAHVSPRSDPIPVAPSSSPTVHRANGATSRCGTVPVQEIVECKHD